MAKRPGRYLLSKKCLPLTYLSFKYTVNWQIYWLWNFFSLLHQIRIRVHHTIEPKVFSLSRSIIWTQFRKLWSSIFLQQWDKIGLFQKFLAANFLSKNSLNTLATIWATLKSITHQYKLHGYNLDKFGLLFISTSGHTGRDWYLLWIVQWWCNHFLQMT